MKVSFTYDEAYSFFHFVGAPLRTVLFFQGAVTATNHSLNSLLMTLANRWIGSSELALRLPNVLAFVGYAAAVLLFSRRLSHLTSRVLAVVLLLLNPFVLEIFSLARGYGLALCFVLGSVAALAAALDPETKERVALRRLTQSTVLAGASVFAILAFLNYFLPLAIVALGLRLSLMRRSGSLNRERGALALAFGSVSASLAIVGLYAGPAIWQLRMRKELYYGGQAGFWRDTVDSLIRCWLYVQPYGAALKPICWSFVVLVLCVGVLIALRSVREPPKPPVATGLLRALLAILMLGGLGSVLQHFWFHTPFLINRTASWMLPVLLLVFAVEIEIGLSASARTWRTAAAICAWIAVAGCAIHTGLSANTRYAILQYHDADTKQMLQDLSALQRSAGDGSRLTVWTSWELAPTIEYYRVTRPLKWLGPVTDTPGPSDVAFLSTKDLGLSRDLVIWKRYPTTGNTLLVAPPRFPIPGKSEEGRRDIRPLDRGR